MSNTNFCEGTGEILAEDFINLVAEEGRAIRIANALGASKLVGSDRSSSVVDLMTSRLQDTIDSDSTVDKANTCANRMLAGECELYDLVDTESLVAFDLRSREGK